MLRYFHNRRVVTAETVYDKWKTNPLSDMVFKGTTLMQI